MNIRGIYRYTFRATYVYICMYICIHTVALKVLPSIYLYGSCNLTLLVRKFLNYKTLFFMHFQEH